MNPYLIAGKIRQSKKSLDDFFYYSFSTLEPEMRTKLEFLISDLSRLADHIEKEADASFENKDFKDER